MHPTPTLRKVARTPALPEPMQAHPPAAEPPPEPPLRVTPDDERIERVRSTADGDDDTESAA